MMPIQPRAVVPGTGLNEGLGEDLVLREEAGGEGEAREEEGTNEHRPGDDSKALLLAESRDLPEVQLPGETVHHGPGTEEEHRLEEGVREDVEGRAEARDHAEPQEHVLSWEIVE